MCRSGWKDAHSRGVVKEGGKATPLVELGGTMAKRDLRQQLLGHLDGGSGNAVTRDVSLGIRCQKCGGRLDMETDTVTGEVVEECRRCHTRHPVPRFRPMEEA